MKGYWQKPEATAAKLNHGPLPGEQVLYTGDYCRLDDERYLYFVSLMDDIIKCRGEMVSPREVEDVLMNIPEKPSIRPGRHDDLISLQHYADITLN
jgi:acyl-CoA synthetase (AMP-forming)/AMP-acid ligase II